MILEQWRSTWQQLIGPGSPYEVVSAAEGGLRYFRHAPSNLLEAIEAGRAHGEREFLVWEQQRLSFADFFEQADRLAAQLSQRFAVRQGDRVAIAMRNQPAWLVAFVAIQRCGAVCVPLNSWGLRDELFHGLQDSGAQVLVCDEQRQQLLAGDLIEERLISIVVGAAPGRMLPANCQRFEGLIKAPPLTLPAVAISPDDPALILYTSGTTSRAKGVLSNHRAVCQALAALEFQAAFCAMSSPERIKAVIDSGLAPTNLMAVPLFHVSGLHAQFLLALRSGRRLLLMYKWDVDKAFDLIRDEHCTQFNGAPVMMHQLLGSPRFASSDSDTLYGLGLGGAAASGRLLSLVTQRKPHAISGSGYGLTESNGICAAVGGDQFVYKPDSVGWPLPIVDVCIGPHPSAPLPPGHTGLIWLRSSTLMTGYWQLPKTSAETLQEGWLDTGDIGHVDEEGFLYITDRAKDMINRAGEMISASEIESCICEMPGVIEAAAFAVADEALGERLALVLRSDLHPPPSSEQVCAFIGQRLAAYKVPAEVHALCTPLPRNASGKLIKEQVRQLVVDA
ncbi:class I adenylate-forming enzyme family protein [Pseudomonas kermanshahensis]|uniref:class I adenylate-forming enzyme family protein n=1 Tax=Pseudomonas kermanshahensis TaxID=2745482 RepID=UPI0023DAB428|nr:class I adenylate-forming enzyme family protein [Pseudomonas kermanshahensis]WEL57768.1 class I adenylate-forming enzyme family protein [Pseudomonas kermanshahensis]